MRRAATARGRAGVGAFVVEGQRLLVRALRARWVPRHVLVGASIAESPRHTACAEALAAAGVVPHVVADAELLELAEGRNSGLVTALFEVPASVPLGELLAGRATPACWLVLVDVVEPGNVGALVRTALAAGAAGVICVGATDPFHPKAVRTSLGSLFKVPLARLSASDDLFDELFDALRAAGVYSLAAVARAGEALDRASWPAGNVAVLVGNEGQGLSNELKCRCDARVSIDLSKEADSFCVNAAAAICLYEVRGRMRACGRGALSALTSPPDLTRQDP